jgi:phosphohistidine phosphatase
MRLLLVHHAEAVGEEVDTRRPLSPAGAEHAARLAAEAAARGIRPAAVWHSGKLRARQTAHAFWQACNALAEFTAVPDLQPGDAPARFRDRLRAEPRDLVVVGHFPQLPALLSLLLGADSPFPPHGAVALETSDDGETWKELWRLG